MSQSLAKVTIVVNDYDEAITYYTQTLGFDLMEDEAMGNGKRWVVVAPGGGDASLLLAKATTDEQRAAVGRQTGGRVGFFLHTTDFAAYYEQIRSRGVTFIEEPREESYGRVVVFEDLYGNRWDLVEPKPTPPANRIDVE